MRHRLRHDQPGASTATRSLKDQQAQLLGLQNAVRLHGAGFRAGRPAPGAPGGRAMSRRSWPSPARPARHPAGRGAHARRLGESGRAAAPGTATRGLFPRERHAAARVLERARPDAGQHDHQARSAHAREDLHAPLPRCQPRLAAAVAAAHRLPGLRVAGATLRMRPLAVEITLDTEDWGKIVRIIEIAG